VYRKKYGLQTFTLTNPIVFHRLDERGGPNHLGNLCDAPVLAVPQRAMDIPPALAQKYEPMESKAQRRFDPIKGDTRTTAELNAMGNPAAMLNVGLVVQPMYYYMGHISRHVPRGTRAVSALVNSANGPGRTFRPIGQVVPGGGINDLARDGIEVTLWPCEGSTRQSWTLNHLGQFQVTGHDWLGVPTKSCLSDSVDHDFGSIVLSDCNVTRTATFEIKPVQPLNLGAVLLATPSGTCLQAKPLKNNGGASGPRGGAQVIYGDCSDSAAQWTYSRETGELLSTFFGNDVCLTTGWPFLQVGAFDNHVLIILNEANDAANYVVNDGDTTVMTSSIPAHSIQTVLL